MAVKNGNYFNRRQNPFTGEDSPITVSSNNQYEPITPRIEVIGGVSMLVADLPEIPVATLAIRIWSINGSTISSDFTEDTAGSSVPAPGHFMRALSTSDRPNLIRLPSDVQGLKIGFEFQGLGQVLCAKDYEDFKAKTIQTTGAATVGGDINANGKINGVTVSNAKIQTESIRYHYTESRVSIDTGLTLTFPVGVLDMYDKDRSVICVSVYCWNESDSGQDEVVELYNGPLRWFYNHTSEITLPSFRKKVGTYFRCCYYIMEYK